LFVGTFSDKIGFRAAIILAFALQTVGYFCIALLPYKAIVPLALFLLLIGGAFIKSLITGTVAKTTTSNNRAKAYSIFYMMVNIGSFTGKTIAAPVRIDYGVEFVSYVSAALTLVALVIVIFAYKNVETEKVSKSLQETWNGLLKAIRNPRLLVLMLIIGGFWLIQHQMYATLPKYLLRLVDESSKPEWLANINPLVVVSFVYAVNAMTKKMRALNVMSVGMFLMPVSVAAMASGILLTQTLGSSISVFGLFSLHPITLMLAVGIGIQGLAECFISPRYLEYFSLQSPKGEEGTYLGFAHLHSFFGNAIGFVMSGYLLDAYCPNPNRADLKHLSLAELEPYYANADYIWYAFTAIAILSAVALIIYGRVTANIDKKKEAAA
jgi:dipeptide/tripeptide permease